MSSRVPGGAVCSEEVQGGGVEFQLNRAARFDARKSAILCRNLRPVRQPRIDERTLAKPLDDNAVADVSPPCATTVSDSGRTPSSMPVLVRRRTRQVSTSDPSARRALRRSPEPETVTGRKFIAGDPTKVATKRDAGRA